MFCTTDMELSESASEKSAATDEVLITADLRKVILFFHTYDIAVPEKGTVNGAD